MSRSYLLRIDSNFSSKALPFSAMPIRESSVLCLGSCLTRLYTYTPMRLTGRKGISSKMDMADSCSSTGSRHILIILFEPNGSL
ncbi:MAG: hypothetical protein IKR87_03075, partial [Candidatus Methanomethylophilaceae archaeon]|nr:hypothetical protein [Candidatus Methanomethylophilaceae archaeon]